MSKSKVEKKGNHSNLSDIMVIGYLFHMNSDGERYSLSHEQGILSHEQ